MLVKFFKDHVNDHRVQVFLAGDVVEIVPPLSERGTFTLQELVSLLHARYEVIQSINSVIQEEKSK